MDGTEGIVGIMFIEILSLNVPAFGMPVGTGVVHIHSHIVGLYLLSAQREVEAMREKELCLGGVVHALGPIVFLVCQSGTIEESSLQHYRYADIEGIAHGATYVTHVAHLLGDEGTVGEILLVWRTVGVDGKRHTELTESKLQSADWFQPCVCVEHLYLALIAKIYLRLILDD